jgi:hypothetical protein
MKRLLTVLLLAGMSFGQQPHHVKTATPAMVSKADYDALAADYAKLKQQHDDVVKLWEDALSKEYQPVTIGPATFTTEADFVAEYNALLEKNRSLENYNAELRLANSVISTPQLPPPPQTIFVTTPAPIINVPKTTFNDDWPTRRSINCTSTTYFDQTYTNCF